MYSVPGGWSPYLSYSESFTPVANIRGQPIEPLRGKQWELGLKFESADGRTGFSAAAYDLREVNRIADDPVNHSVVQLPHTQTGGLELEFKAVRAGGELIANYSWTDVDAPTVPALTLLDAVFAWDQAHWRVALNVNNLTDKVYVATCLARGDCWWGARRNVVASLAYRW